MNWQDLKKDADDERRWIEMPLEIFKKVAAVVDASRLLFDLCENDIGMDKTELTELRQALKELEK